MATGTIIAIITITVSLSGVIIALVYNAKKEKRDDNIVVKRDAFEEAKIIVKLEEIGEDVKEIKYDIRETRKELSDIDKRVTVAEKSISSLHKRLDEHIGKD